MHKNGCLFCVTIFCKKILQVTKREHRIVSHANSLIIAMNVMLRRFWRDDSLQFVIVFGT